MHSVSPSLARATAQFDFSQGASLEDNPYDPDTDAYDIWEQEMRLLFKQEDALDLIKDNSPCAELA
jgi:hypothetical protein